VTGTITVGVLEDSILIISTTPSSTVKFIQPTYTTTAISVEAGVYGNSGIHILLGYSFTLTLEITPISSFSGTSTSTTSSTTGKCTFSNIKINNPGTYQFKATYTGMTSVLGTNITISPFTLVSIQLSSSVTEISAYFSFTLSISLLNEVNSAYTTSTTVTLAGSLTFGGSTSLTTSSGSGTLSVYGIKPGNLLFTAESNGKSASVTVIIKPNIMKFDYIGPTVITP
jgi:hypothetical protein